MKPKRGNAVWEYMKGNTKMRVCDDCCRNKTPEDTERAMANIARIYIEAKLAEMVRKEREEGRV